MKTPANLSAYAALRSLPPRRVPAPLAVGCFRYNRPALAVGCVAALCFSGFYLTIFTALDAPTEIIAAFSLPLAIGVSLASAWFVGAARRLRLLKHGNVAEGEAVAVAPAGASLGEELFEVRYRFRDVNGREFSGATTLPEGPRLKALAPGDAVLVCYDPKRPARNACPVVE
jgi:hypothetical protein